MVTITTQYPIWQMPENILPLDLDTTAGRIGALAYAEALVATDWLKALKIRRLVDERVTLDVSLKLRNLTWDNLRIWWTSAEDVKQVQDQHLLYDRVWPWYIRTAFAYRCMTAERGLLYHAPEMLLETKTVRDYAHNREMAERVKVCGGVVFCREELPFALLLPGFVTDDKLIVEKAT